MYDDIARFYDELNSQKDYVDEARRITEVIRTHKPDAESLLDVACGTGRHLEYLRREFDVTGVDSSAAMLAQARARLPDVELVRADMTELALDQTFDAITCLFSAIGYVKTLDSLHTTLRQFSNHLERGGVAIIDPWIRPEDYEDGRVTAEVPVDRPDMKAVRTIVSSRRGRTSILNMQTLVATPRGTEHVSQILEHGLFSLAEHTAAFEAAGFDVEHEPVGLIGRGLYVGVKRA